MARSQLANLERIATLLACVGVTRWQAAQRLGIGERTLRDRLRKYGIGCGAPVDATTSLCLDASRLIDSLDDLLIAAVRRREAA